MVVCLAPAPPQADTQADPIFRAACQFDEADYEAPGEDMLQSPHEGDGDVLRRPTARFPGMRGAATVERCAQDPLHSRSF